MFSWFSPFTISQERQCAIRESFVDAITYLSAKKAEREEVCRMWEATDFSDPDLSREHLDLDNSVAMVSTIPYIVFLPIRQLMIS
jgi:hypothetical protein